MKKLLLLCILATLSANILSAQCIRDSSVLVTGQILSPRPYSDSFQVITTLPACINEPYTQNVTLNVPLEFVFSGIPASIDSVIIATSGAVTNLPIGLNYTCDPPNCHFKKQTLGCILITGTPTTANTPGTKDLGINLKVYSPILPFPIDLAFPGTIAPGQHFYLVVKNPGECAVGTNDLSGQIGTMSARPNPFGQQTTISVASQVSDRFQFEVFNMLGQKIYAEPVQLNTGDNQFTFDAGDIANGTYYFSLSNHLGRATRAFVIQR